MTVLSSDARGAVDSHAWELSGDALHRGGAAPGVWRRSFAGVEIVGVPRADQLGDLVGTDPRTTLRGVARAMAAGLVNLPPTYAVELRYVARPGRLRAFLTARVDDQPTAAAQSVLGGAVACLPSEFATAPAAPPAAAGQGVVVELRRDLRFEPPTYDYVARTQGLEAIPVLGDRPGDGSGWSRLLRALLDGAPAELSVVLKPTALLDHEADACAQLLAILTHTSRPHEDIDVVRRPVLRPADPVAVEALPRWSELVEGLNRPLLFKVALRTDPARAISLGTAMAAHLALGADASPRPMTVVAPTTEREHLLSLASFELLECARWQTHAGWASPAAPSALERIEFLATIDEAAALLPLPVPGAVGVGGMAEVAAERLLTPAPTADVEGPALLLGRQLSGAHGGAVATAVDHLTRHALVVGSPGAGKTTTVHTLLSRLWHEHRVPWLAIEPAKREYRGLAALLPEASVFTVGRDDLRPLGINLLRPAPGVRCQEHIATLMAAFKLALPLFQPLPALLEQALEEAYDRAGWRSTDTTGRRVPEIGDLVEAFDGVFARYPYRGEARNLAVALRLRLDGLSRGARGSVFAGVETPADELLGRPAVVELAAVADPEDQKLITALLIQRVRSAAERRGASRGLRHVTVLEEAHRLLKAAPAARDSASGDRAEADSVAMLCEAISELRGVGEGFVLSSQFPSQLADAAVANTGTKVIHRLEREVDRRAILDDIGAPSELSAALGRLPPGVALYRGLESPSPLVFEVAAPPGVDTGRAIPDDALTPNPPVLCGAAGCQGCDAPTRAAGLRLARSASGLRRRLDGTAAGIQSIARELCGKTSDDAVAHCALVRLNGGL